MCNYYKSRAYLANDITTKGKQRNGISVMGRRRENGSRETQRCDETVEGNANDAEVTDFKRIPFELV